MTATIDIQAVRPFLGLLVVLGAFAFSPGSAPAAPPLSGGAMAFGQINGPADPEDYPWEVDLAENQELVQIDDRHAVVYYTGEERAAFGISATAAHDADGTGVPTTLAVSDGNIVTLTVHHRAGNPAAGWASFVYPVTAGPGWAGGFQTHHVQVPPPEPMPAGPIAAMCIVPKLSGRSLKAARAMLRNADCALGSVRGEKSKRAKVVRQYRPPGKALAVGTEVGVRLGG